MEKNWENRTLTWSADDIEGGKGCEIGAIIPENLEQKSARTKQSSVVFGKCETEQRLAVTCCQRAVYWRFGRRSGRPTTQREEAIRESEGWKLSA
ncbi:hypothetical protein TNCT_560421 [Trichonephila clavata]|uniref:Uncharacterized protein n=1 Tax=Trichonephila clavata TaxID=2740835 RepID=A0A8X6GM76_TRICU|nr:hypothetical protein TNCT_560421 [Trichonephila clavata]